MLKLDNSGYGVYGSTDSLLSFLHSYIPIKVFARIVIHCQMVSVRRQIPLKIESPNMCEIYWIL